MFFDDDSEADPGVRVCPECGSEFQPHVLTCIDCGAATVLASDLADRPRPEPSLGNRFSLPRESEAVCWPSGDVESAEAFGLFLERHGVPCRLEPEEPPASATLRERQHPRFKVCVAPGDAARTRALEKKYDQMQIRATGMRFEELPPQGYCPACGTHVGERAEWCPECGLHLGGGSTPDDGTVGKNSE
jgi:rubredoxin